MLYTGKSARRVTTFTGPLAIPARLMLLGVGVVTLWRTRRIEEAHVAIRATRDRRMRNDGTYPRNTKYRAVVDIRDLI